jgi:hypothetical protein
MVDAGAPATSWPLLSPMNFTASSSPGARLRRLLVLLLLALGLLAGVSVSQTQQLEAQVARTELVTLPEAKRLHELAARLDEQRGMAALHLTLHTEAERSALEGRLQAGRLLVERRMAAFAQRLTDDADRQHHQRVSAGLAVFWDVQERLLASSRRAESDPAAAAQARALLTGEGQQVFLRLRSDIQAWWSHTEQAAAAQAQEARVTAQLVARLVWAQAALVAMALAMAWAVLHAPRPAAAGAALDGRAAQAHLQALDAAVAGARRGEPGRASGLSAQEAQQLAEQVAAAARGLQRLIHRPMATSAGAPPGRAGNHRDVDGNGDSLPPR